MHGCEFVNITSIGHSALGKSKLTLNLRKIDKLSAPSSHANAFRSLAIRVMPNGSVNGMDWMRQRIHPRPVYMEKGNFHGNANNANVHESTTTHYSTRLQRPHQTNANLVCFYFLVAHIYTQRLLVAWKVAFNAQCLFSLLRTRESGELHFTRYNSMVMICERAVLDGLSHTQRGKVRQNNELTTEYSSSLNMNNKSNDFRQQFQWQTIPHYLRWAMLCLLRFSHPHFSRWHFSCNTQIEYEWVVVVWKPFSQTRKKPQWLSARCESSVKVIIITHKHWRGNLLLKHS